MATETFVHAKPRRNAAAEARGAVVRLVAAALLLWAALCGIGYLLTHQLQRTSFERRDAWVNRWLAAHRSSTWNTVTHWLTYAAETLPVIAIGLVSIVAVRVGSRAWLRRVAVAAAVAVPVCVAFARLYRGMHFPSDVAGGALLGLVWLTTTWAIILRRRRVDAAP